MAGGVMTRRANERKRISHTVHIARHHRIDRTHDCACREQRRIE